MNLKYVKSYSFSSKKKKNEKSEQISRCVRHYHTNTCVVGVSGEERGKEAERLFRNGL